MVRENVPAQELQLQPTIVMKDHAFDRDLDDLGMSPEDLEREVEVETPPVPQCRVIVPRH
jgi:hypothetical protein